MKNSIGFIYLFCTLVCGVYLTLFMVLAFFFEDEMGGLPFSLSKLLLGLGLLLLFFIGLKIFGVKSGAE